MREYVKKDADIRIFLLNIEKGKYLKEYMLAAYIYQLEDEFYLIFATEQHILYINLREKYIIWKMKMNELQDITKLKNGVTLTLKGCSIVDIVIPEQEDVEAIYSILRGIKHI